MLLNDLQNEEERLAYLLGLNVERHVLGKRSRFTLGGVLMLGGVLLLAVLWQMAGFMSR